MNETNKHNRKCNCIDTARGILRLVAVMKFPALWLCLRRVRNGLVLKRLVDTRVVVVAPKGGLLSSYPPVV